MGDGEFFIRICVHSSVLLNPKNHERVVRIDVFKTTIDEDGAKGCRWCSTQGHDRNDTIELVKEIVEITAEDLDAAAEKAVKPTVK
ncbi:hypothetical protein Pint_07474 [Pistacia integerrima]|uniref:Uncharacterized protein n=1 Tax=Pistacia integerrima TaxID=434235 RepID=A0ACC0XXI4_9ROSI|nr:hypothetical protein Pint_07474 [Pistacia integerrima]